MLIRLGITYVLNLFDIVMTQYFVNKYGTAIEGNPIGRWLIDHPIALIAWKCAIVALLLLLLYHFRNVQIANIGSWITLGVYIALAMYHIILFIITRRYL